MGRGWGLVASGSVSAKREELVSLRNENQTLLSI